MKKPKKEITGSLVSLFAQAPLRAIFEATPDEMAVLLVSQWIYLRRRRTQEEVEGIDLLAAILCTPDPLVSKEEEDKPVDQAKIKIRMSRRSLERALARLRKRGWGKTHKTYGGLGRFIPDVPALMWEEAEEAFYNSAILAGLAFTKSPQWRPNPAIVAGYLSTKDIDKNIDSAADASNTPDQVPDLEPKPRASARPDGDTGAILSTFREWWLRAFPGQKFVAGPGDGKLAQSLVKQGVLARDLSPLLVIWPDNADQFTKDNGFGLWLFCRQFNKLQLKARTAAPACAHTNVKWDQAFRDGTQVGTCMDCGNPVTKMWPL